MARDSAGVTPQQAPKDEWVNLLREMETSHIAQVLAEVCIDCQSLIKSRLLNLINKECVHEESGKVGIWSNSVVESSSASLETSSLISPINSSEQLSNYEIRTPTSSRSSYSMSQDKNNDGITPLPINGKPQMLSLFSSAFLTSDGNHRPSSTVYNGSEDEWRLFAHVKRNKNFVHYERVNGKEINVVQGLELHSGVFSADEQKKIVESVYEFQRMGRKGQLMARTYSEPVKWMRGKGRVTIQFGCCYNYAVDKDGNPPGIIRDEEVDPLPPVFKQMIARMVRWHVLPPTCVPNSCIVNIYDKGDCIPPHIDHHDFLRPFCTVSFLTECNIKFGTSLKIAGPGEFSGPVSIPLPVGSILVLKGNGADVAKHCVPAVPAKRISVTFRRMDDSKMPYNFLPDPELLNLRPLHRSSLAKPDTPTQNQHQENRINRKMNEPNARVTVVNSFTMQNDDFPPLGGLKSGKR